MERGRGEKRFPCQDISCLYKEYFEYSIPPSPSSLDFIIAGMRDVQFRDAGDKASLYIS